MINYKPHPKQLEFLNDDRPRVIITSSPLGSNYSWIRKLFMEKNYRQYMKGGIKMQVVNKKDLADQLLELKDGAYNQLLLDILNWDAIPEYLDSAEFQKLKHMIATYLDARYTDGKWRFPSSVD